MPKIPSSLDFRSLVSRVSAKRPDRPRVHVTSRGGLHVDVDTLFENSDVRETVEKAAERELESRSAKSSSRTP